MLRHSQVRLAEAANPRAVVPIANVLIVRAEFARVAIANAEAVAAKLERPNLNRLLPSHAVSNHKRRLLAIVAIAPAAPGLVAVAKYAAVQIAPVIHKPSRMRRRQQRSRVFRKRWLAVVRPANVLIAMIRLVR